MTITYRQEQDLSPEAFVDVLHRSGLAERRPVHDPARIAAMCKHGNILITARNAAGALVGVSRALSDFSFCCYLSDLAVDRAYQKQGIGRRLILETQKAAGPDAMLILLAAPDARTYYPHVGMQQHDSCWILPRAR